MLDSYVENLCGPYIWIISIHALVKGQEKL